MIEEALIFALGFLLASLAALAVAPAFWRRAMRLSARRLEMQLPLSFEEVRAGRDLVRAEAAAEVRRLEQKVQSLTRLQAAHLAELGRRAAAESQRESELRLVEQQNRELIEEAERLRRELAEASAELGAASKDSYDTSGLVARKNHEIRDLRERLNEIEALCGQQQRRIELFEAEAARQKEALEAEAVKIAHLEGELSALRLQHQSDQVALKAAVTRLADREAALEAAVKREKDLVRQRKLQAEAARAAESAYIEKIERLRSERAATAEALSAARRTADRLAKELVDLRELLPPQDEEAALMLREENELLRQKIAEIGAAVVRAAGGGKAEDKIRSPDEIAEKEIV